MRGRAGAPWPTPHTASCRSLARSSPRPSLSTAYRYEPAWCCLKGRALPLLQGRAVGLLRTARGSRAQLSAMIMPRHADAEAQDVVRTLLDQATAP